MAPRKYFAHSLLVLVALLICAAIPARADTIVLQTGFEADTPNPKPNGTIVGTGGADIGSGFTTLTTPSPGFSFIQVFSGNFCDGRGLQSQCLTLFGIASITSVDTFAPGDYQLMFDLYGGSPLTVMLGNFSQTIFGSFGPNAAQTFSFTFTLASSAQLVFLTTMSQADLDDIRLTRLEPTAVPEPMTMLLLGTGLAGIAAKVRSRRKANQSKEA